MWAHHDGSEKYVSPQHHSLGGEATVSIRVHHDYPVNVHVRTVEDGEPRYFEAQTNYSRGNERWFDTTINVRNPVTNYRFLITSVETDHPSLYLWVNGTGMHTRDVSDAHDFRLTAHPPAPTWARSSVFYQIFPDRFATTGVATSGGKVLPDWAIPRQWEDPVAPAWPETSHEYFGGDLPGVTEKLDYLQDLGITGVYLTPIFPGGSNHRYDASTFTAVDPLLGGDEALVELSSALHARGMTIIGDLTTNHTGNHHEWFLTAQLSPTSPEHSFYYWTDDGGYECWLGIDTLPKLNYHSKPLWDRFVKGPESVVAHWLKAPFNLDGWRIDVANMTGRRLADDFAHEVARTVRATSEEINPDALVIGEHFHDATGDVDGDGWHANMNYTGFTRPLWTWLAEENTHLGFINTPAAIPSLPGAQVAASMDDFLAQIPWQTQQVQWNMLGSHDTARIRTVVGSDERLVVAAAALLTLPGTPVIFAGDEFGFEGTNGEHSRTTIAWDRKDTLNPVVHGAYQDLIHLRTSHLAFAHGGKHWVLVEDDALGFVRDTGEQRVLVVLTRSEFSGHVHIPGEAVTPESVTELFNFGGVSITHEQSTHTDTSCLPGDSLAVSARGAGVIIVSIQ